MEMRSRDWFCVGVRLFGIYYAGQALEFLLGLIGTVLGMHSEQQLSWATSDARTITYSAMYTLTFLVISLICLFGAEKITAIVYREPQKPGSEADTAVNT